MRGFSILQVTLVVALVGAAFVGRVGLVAADSTVLLSTRNSVLQYGIDNAGVWSLVSTFASGTYAGEPLSESFGLAIDGQDRVYIGEQKDGGRVLRFDTDGNFIDVFATEGVDYDGFAEAMTIGPDGALYMTNAFGTNASDQVYRFDVDTGASSVFVANSGGSYVLDNPRGLDFGFGGDLFVADRNSSAIRQFDGSTGAYVGDLDFALPVGPQALSYDAASDRLLVGVGFTQIREYSSGGSSSELYNTGGLEGVLDVEVFSENIFWTATNLGEVHRLDEFNVRTPVVTGLDSPRHMLEIPLQVLLTADFNGDDLVDDLDLTDPVLGWEARYGSDLDGSDFLAWQREFGSGVGAAAAVVTVPEPSSVTLVLLAIVCMVPRSRGSSMPEKETLGG